MGTKVITGLVRMSYVHVWEPQASMEEGGKDKYSVNLIIDKKDKATVKAIEKAVDEAKAEGLKSKFEGKIIESKFGYPLRDGDEDRPDDPNYAGCYFINASSLTKPGIVDINVKPILDRSEFYSGCYGKASINFYPYHVKGKKGIACGLNNLQKIKDGEPLGGNSRPEDDFKVEESDEDEMWN
ncbi:DUF2815 family protein [Siphonobacter sp. SORGH_AS_1065]|uniref:DUF2815 family protein n=1 Tax=Siphonobacter sp. SORGH_AS_1065 TaxID=3041795 RepID=UPI00278043D8|nr:DUF2815 family protein [Siphonobacter sp. SORGH_AS_1065]MDQ1088599.1 hypothetical protein [Siphonobacter sp. SORGH_AS_1065]